MVSNVLIFSRRLAPLVAATALVFAPTASIGAASTGSLPSGSDINATTNNHLNSGSAKVGDAVSMTVREPYPLGGSAVEGAVIYGKVITAQPAGQGRNPKLEISVYKIKYASGTTVAIVAKINKIEVKQKSNLAKEAGGAVAGMLIGNWIGKSLGTNIGGTIGAIGGYMITANSKTNFDVPIGSKVYMTLTQSLPLY